MWIFRLSAIFLVRSSYWWNTKINRNTMIFGCCVRHARLVTPPQYKSFSTANILWSLIPHIKQYGVPQFGSFFSLFVQTTGVLSSIEIKYFWNHNQIVQFTFIKSNTQQSRAITSIKSNAPINHLHKTKRRHYVNLWHTLGSGFRKDP